MHTPRYFGYDACDERAETHQAELHHHNAHQSAKVGRISVILNQRIPQRHLYHLAHADKSDKDK